MAYFYRDLFSIMSAIMWLFGLMVKHWSRINKVSLCSVSTVMIMGKMGKPFNYQPLITSLVIPFVFLHVIRVSSYLLILNYIKQHFIISSDTRSNKSQLQ